MKNLMTTLFLSFVFLFVINPVHAQKKVKGIKKAYQEEVYPEVIKKAAKLKLKHQSRVDVQLMLADSYWNMGAESQSIKLYNRVAAYADLPDPFEKKYLKAKKSTTKFVPDSSTTSSHTAIKESEQEKETPKEEVTFTKLAPAPIANKVVVKKETPKESTKHISVPSDHYASPNVSKEYKTIKTINVDASYRIRVGSFSKSKELNLSQLESIGPVEVVEWKDKKIVYTGFYSSSEVAQNYIKEFLQEYRNAVVVRKRDGRYRSVALGSK